MRAAAARILTCVPVATAARTLCCRMRFDPASGVTFPAGQRACIEWRQLFSSPIAAAACSSGTRERCDRHDERCRAVVAAAAAAQAPVICQCHAARHPIHGVSKLAAFDCAFEGRFAREFPRLYK
jgi:hypothetical protein